MFDITSQAASDTAAIHIKGLDGEFLYAAPDKPVRIVIYGPGSPQYAVVEDRQTARAIKRMQDNEGKVSVAPPVQRAAELAEDLAAITVAFENFTYPPAAEKQGAAHYEAFYADKALGYMADQVQKAVKNWGNFKPASATS